ncbi:HD domain-containing protein [Mycolicibacterium sp.]|uniref:HD domain-containing protein n=1 Tax=Mycolicibacterium sp. TaxID=2320850 RepID=UPI003D0D08D4
MTTPPATPSTATAIATATAARWELPDSEVASAASQLVTESSPAVLTNHCVRSYLFGREFAASQGLVSGVDYDDETHFLACVLHDLGLTAYGAGDQRFEIEGADAAARFLREHHVADNTVTTVWQAIALHSSLGLAHRFGTVHAITIAGISFDVDGMSRADYAPGFIARVIEDWPRHDLGYALADAIARDARGNPMTAPPFTLPGHLNELINGVPPLAFTDVVANSGWGDERSAG